MASACRRHDAVTDRISKTMKSYRRHHSVYVIELDPAVLKRRKFREANPDHNRDRECLYVGMTGICPEERFQRHKQGHKACWYVKVFGKRLRLDLYDGLNPMTYEEACDMEVELAERLRADGYAVWQH